MTKEFFLYVKLIKVNPETGKAYGNICEMQPQIAVHLGYFVEEFMRGEITLYETRKAVRTLLEKIHAAFDCPLGWRVEMQTPVVSFIGGKLVQVDIERKNSQDFAYIPDNGQTEVDVEFLKEWTLSAAKGGAKDA